MYTKGQWIIDGTQIVSVEKEIICELNPVTEYPTVFQRSQKEALKNALLIISSAKMYEVIHEVLEVLEGNEVPDIRWIHNRLHDGVS